MPSAGCGEISGQLPQWGPLGGLPEIKILNFRLLRNNTKLPLVVKYFIKQKNFKTKKLLIINIYLECAKIFIRRSNPRELQPKYNFLEILPFEAA